MAPKKKNKNKGKGKDKKGPAGKLRKRALRDVKVANQPALDALKRQEDKAKDQYDESSNTVNTIYDALAQELKGIDFNKGAGGISDQLTENIGGLAALLGTSTPAGEQAAAAGMLGGIGGGSLGLLAGGQQRNLAYQASTKRQGAIERVTTRKGMLEDYNDLLASFADGRMDIKSAMGPQITARLDELRDRRRAMRQNEKELDIQKSLADRDFGFAKNERNYQRNQTRQAQNAANDVLTDEQEDTRNKRSLRRVNKDITRIKGNTPGLTKEDGQWGTWEPGDVTTDDWSSVEFDPLTRLNRKVRKRRRIRKRVDN